LAAASPVFRAGAFRIVFASPLAAPFADLLAALFTASLAATLELDVLTSGLAVRDGEVLCAAARGPGLAFAVVLVFSDLVLVAAFVFVFLTVFLVLDFAAFFFAGAITLLQSKRQARCHMAMKYSMMMKLERQL
jgi:hypothetical protein